MKFLKALNHFCNMASPVLQFVNKFLIMIYWIINIILTLLHK